ncbi:MAG TPA: glycoside hydrolase family 15 protein [Candidatus Binatia bacterium]|jgi:GH15 family glucan-1,4-alpha-glucosidase|nr:glycoside hydrolase family 15 protein [Candidatus Binatia bacterium]
MPRSLVLGNGNLLIGLDAHGQVRDVYFERVGLENHANGRPQKVGIFIDGKISWLDDNGWRTEITYLPETLIGQTVAENAAIGIRLTFEDFVYNETNIFIRKIRVDNLAQRDREFRIVFHNDLEVGGYTHGVTAMWYPRRQCLIHYRGMRMFLFNGHVDGHSMDGFSVGMTRYSGLEGTWKDAEDGVLSGNPIEHGRVDSAASFRCTLRAGASHGGWYWMVAASSLAKAEELNDDVVKRTPEHLYQTTKDFWRAWVNKQRYSFHGLTADMVRIFKTSLLVMRAHTDNGGGIIASSDSDMLQHGKDTYSYVWPRDAAFAAMTFAKAGYWDIARRYFEYQTKLLSNEGYFMHKYLPDGSLGSSWHPWVEEHHDVLPIQEDETAIVIYALWVYYEASRDIEFIEEIYNGFIKKAANFLATYRHEKTNLPLHSYDLWEEHRSVSTYTAATVVGGLEAAAKFADLLGKAREKKTYQTIANEIRESIDLLLIDRSNDRIMKAVKFDDAGDRREDARTDASSFYGLLLFNVVDVKDPFAGTCAKNCDRDLWWKSPIGGLARYEKDRYFMVDDRYPNPWIITTLWHTEFMIKSARSEEDLKPVKEIFQWVVDRALTSGVLPEQVHPITGAPLSATPLVWSHAAYVYAVIHYLEKLEQLGIARAEVPLEEV